MHRLLKAICIFTGKNRGLFNRFRHNSFFILIDDVVKDSSSYFYKVTKRMDRSKRKKKKLVLRKKTYLSHNERNGYFALSSLYQMLKCDDFI